jgi:DUF971 family protein
VTDPATPVELTLRKDRDLCIRWSDGREDVYTIPYLRQNCPCAGCREERDQQAQNKTRLRVLGGNQASPLVLTGAQKVGNYAIRLIWSDGHDTGIYSFEYLRQIAPGPAASPGEIT